MTAEHWSARVRTARVVNLDGRFVPDAGPLVSLYDSGFATGELVVEVTRTFAHRLFRLDDHLSRLLAGAAELGINLETTPEELRAATLDTLARNLPTEHPVVDWQVIHYVSRGPESAFAPVDAADAGPTVIIHCLPLHRRQAAMATTYEHGADLVVPAQRAIPTSIVGAHIKSGGRIDHDLARLQARRHGPFASAVMIDPDGHVVGGAGTNIFLVRDGQLITPAVEDVVPGVTRALVLELAGHAGIPIQERRVTLDEARGADEAFLTATVLGMVHGRTFDGRLLGDGTPGPVTSAVRRAFVAAAGVDFVEQAKGYAAAATSAADP